jgi:hypothetical protein
MDQAVMMGGYTGNGTTCSGTPYPCGHDVFQFTNNLTPVGTYGFAGDGTAQGITTLNAYLPGNAFPSPTPWVFAGDVLVGGNPAFYPAGNFFPSSLSAVGFVDLTGGNYALAPTSLYKNAGTDGKDVGADMGAIDAATAGVLTGVTADPPADPSADTTPPVVAVTSPASGTSVSGTVTVTATASDDVGVLGVQFKLDGALLGAEVIAAPYAVSWNTTTVLNGAHTLTAVARDAAGNVRTSAAVSVTVTNDVTAPVVSGVTASSVTSSGATIGWTTNEASDTQVEYGRTTAYGTTTSLTTSLVTLHSQALSGLAPNTVYHYRVKSRDAAGNLAVSGDFTFKTKRR